MASKEDLLLQKERKDLKLNPIEGAIFKWDDANLRNFQVLITGPEGSLYEGGEFEVEISIPSRYPKQAPRVVMKTPIIHPNIEKKTGAVCVACLRVYHNSKVRIRTIVEEIIDALKNPNTKDPLDLAASQLFQEDFEQFKEQVQLQIAQNKLNQ